LLAASRKEVLVEETTAEVDPVSVDELAAARERRAALRAAVATLPIQQRRVVHSHLMFPSLNYDELGQALGIPRGSIGPTRARGLARLRTATRLREATGAA
jgi:DNA-directed RNA polymerase specialized sigma24 family protein